MTLPNEAPKNAPTMTPEAVCASLKKLDLKPLRLSKKQTSLFDALVDGDDGGFNETECEQLSEALASGKDFHVGAALDEILSVRLSGGQGSLFGPGSIGIPQAEEVSRSADAGNHVEAEVEIVEDEDGDDDGFEVLPPDHDYEIQEFGNPGAAQDRVVDLCYALKEPSFRDLQTLMHHSYFAPALKGKGKDQLPVDQTTIKYVDRKVSFTITPHSSCGMATIFDKDLLIWIIGRLNERIMRGEEISDTLKFSPAQYFKDTQKTKGGSQYDQLEKSLERLSSTKVKIERQELPGRVGKVLKNIPVEWGESFTWVTSYRWAKNIDGRLLWVQVTLPKWIYEQLRAKGGHQMLLKVEKEYFEIGTYVERVLYQLAGRMCGNRARGGSGMSYKMNLSNLFLRCYPARQKTGPFAKENASHWRQFKKYLRDRAKNFDGDGIKGFNIIFEEVDPISGKKLKDPKISFVAKPSNKGYNPELPINKDNK